MPHTRLHSALSSVAFSRGPGRIHDKYPNQILPAKRISVTSLSCWLTTRWASGVRSETIPGYRFASPVRGWEGQQLHRQLAESQRLALQFYPLPSLKLDRGLGTESPSAAKPPCILLLTKYRVIVTNASNEGSIAEGFQCADSCLALGSRGSTDSPASRGFVTTVVRGEQNATDTLSVPLPKLTTFSDS